MPTDPTTVYSVTRLDPVVDSEHAHAMDFAFVASTIYPRGTIVGELTATKGTVGAYASGNSDGTQVPKGIVIYDIATDGYGNISYGAVSGGGPFGQTYPVAPIWISGTFDTTELTGLDATAISNSAHRGPPGVRHYAHCAPQHRPGDVGTTG
jgi:hypothetical protein